MHVVWKDVTILTSVEEEQEAGRERLDIFTVLKDDQVLRVRINHRDPILKTKYMESVNQLVGKKVDLNVCEVPWKIKKLSGVIYYLEWTPHLKETDAAAS